MVELEQAKALRVGDALVRETGWRKGNDGVSRAVSFEEFEVVKVTPKCVTVRSKVAVWGGEFRLFDRNFPLERWQVVAQSWCGDAGEIVGERSQDC